jgi:hypothetical protein
MSWLYRNEEHDEASDRVDSSEPVPNNYKTHRHTLMNMQNEHQT